MIFNKLFETISCFNPLLMYTKPLKSGEGVEPEYFRRNFSNYFSIFITFSYETFEVVGEEGRTGGISRKFSQLSHFLSPSPAQETFEIEDRWEYDMQADF